MRNRLPGFELDSSSAMPRNREPTHFGIDSEVNRSHDLDFNNLTPDITCLWYEKLNNELFPTPQGRILVIYEPINARSVNTASWKSRETYVNRVTRNIFSKIFSLITCRAISIDTDAQRQIDKLTLGHIKLISIGISLLISPVLQTASWISMNEVTSW